jgi:oligopeptide/dipeptide ABC transporter ATP-binding protein
VSDVPMNAGTPSGLEGRRESLLSIRHLSIDYVGSRVTRAVDDLSLDLHAGEIFGLLGESGSGKSTAALGALRLLPPPAVIRSGQVLFEGEDLLTLRETSLAKLRFRKIGVVLQSAMNALSPVLTIGEQLADVMVTHDAASWKAALERSAELLSLVGIPPDRLRSYPHQLSGGMRQRVTIAMALSLRPRLLVLDEPTTALDVLVEREILEQVVRLRNLLGFSVLFVSHDVGAMLEFCDRLGVLYAGRLCEVASRDELLRGGRHPYTRGLLQSLPRLHGPRTGPGGIAGAPPDPAHPPSGCRFHPRCAFQQHDCSTLVPELHPEGSGGLACHHPLALLRGARAEEAKGESQAAPRPVTLPRRAAVLAARGLEKVFTPKGAWGAQPLRVVDDVSLELLPEEVVALVGQSGSGKSTILRMVAGLEQPTRGDVWLDGQRVLGAGKRATLAFRKRVQIILQDPFASLNPVHTVGYHLERALLVHGLVPRAELTARQCALLDRVGLSPAEAFLRKRPHELSGGQRQRVAIARAVAVEPEVILADEPTSMLDVSVRAGILELLANLRRERGLSVLYVTHDLASARVLSDRLLVLSSGRLVEQGPTEAVLKAPAHPYTRSLLAAADRSTFGDVEESKSTF